MPPKAKRQRRRRRRRQPTPDQLRGAIVVVDKTMYVSATAFQDFAFCSMIGYYKHLRKLEAVGPRPAAMAYGEAFHFAMEQYPSTNCL